MKPLTFKLTTDELPDEFLEELSGRLSTQQLLDQLYIRLRLLDECTPSEKARRGRGKKRKLSKAARKAIGDAQRARWAKVKAKKAS